MVSSAFSSNVAPFAVLRRTLQNPCFRHASGPARTRQLSSVFSAFLTLPGRTTRLTWMLLSALMLSSWVQAAEVEYVVTADSAPLNLPFSDAVVIDGLMIMSGQLGVNPVNFTLVPGGIEAETRQIFTNMQALLATHNATLADLVKCTVMIADISQWPAFNIIYLSYFPTTKPARSALGANGLALGAAVELECWASL